MFFQIEKIVVWPKDGTFGPVCLNFVPGKVNVITGTSRTGKSAIIPIIDYCLGADKCRIPVKTIRDACAWFGVVVQTDTGQKLFARREPGNQKATGDMFVSEGSNVKIPDRIESKNTSVEAVKRSLDEYAGLTALDFDEEGIGSGFKKRPSFRDMSAFTYQPQNIVANPEVLFYKTETYEHREKLRTIFPYVLNSITPEIMAKRHELADLKKVLLRKEREFATVRQISEQWMAEIKAKVSEAKELGLVRKTISGDASPEDLVNVLRLVVESSTDDTCVTTDTVSEAVSELVELQKEESETSMEMSRLRKRFSEMSVLRESAERYKGALHVQRDRLKVSDWVWQMHSKNHDCPLCGNPISSATEQLEALHNSLKLIEEEAGRFDTVPAAFDREYERVRSDMRTLSEKLRGIQIRREALERRSEEAHQWQYDSLKTSRFIGHLEQSLQTYERLGKDSELTYEISELRQRVISLEREISRAGVETKTRRALDAVRSNAEKILPLLDVERPNDPISLSIDDLTIRVGGTERDDYLWEIGSGSNWLSYHVAVTLGLQQFFLSLRNSPVPSFIVYDQPSQVYFPKRLAVREAEADFDPEYKDEDIEAVRKAFATFSSVVHASDGRLQIIVLDHASKNVWGGVEHIHCVVEWRNGTKLVPAEWLGIS